jgi:electron transfer flavoprotein beta subunit
VNIIVAMKQIPDLQQVRIRNRQPIFADVPLTFSDLDKNALQAGVELREKVDGKVIVVSAGDQGLEDTIKEALAAGADEALFVADGALKGAGSSLNSEVLAALIRQIDNPGLILFGEGSGDNYSGQVASRVAELLELPQVGFVSKIEMNESTAILTRSLEECEEVLEVKLPVVVTVVAGINEPHIPSVVQILKAGKKPKTVLKLSELQGISQKTDILTISNMAPELKRRRIKIKTVEELIAALEEEGLVRRCG